MLGAAFCSAGIRPRAPALGVHARGGPTQRDHTAAQSPAAQSPRIAPAARTMSTDVNGVEPLANESESEYVARQARIREEAAARMRAKFGGSGGLAGTMGGIGSGGGGGGGGASGASGVVSGLLSTAAPGAALAGRWLGSFAATVKHTAATAQTRRP